MLMMSFILAFPINFNWNNNNEFLYQYNNLYQWQNIRTVNLMTSRSRPHACNNLYDVIKSCPINELRDKKI